MKRPANEARLFDETRAWELLRELTRRQKQGSAVSRPTVFSFDETWRAQEESGQSGVIRVDPSCPLNPEYLVRATDEARQLMELFLPLCIGVRAGAFVIAHLGQTLDGRIATLSGESRCLTGPENHRHLHRLRALCDAVVVGARTVDKDDPELTTRLVPGEHPARVVIDPKRRLSHESRIFRDGLAATWIVCAKGGKPSESAGLIEIVPGGDDGECLNPRAIIKGLKGVGLTRILVEGGGVTVSRFLDAQALDWLQIAVSPVILGAGRPGISLPGVVRLDQLIRPHTRHFEMGADILFECRFDR